MPQVIVVSDTKTDQYINQKVHLNLKPDQFKFRRELHLNSKTDQLKPADTIQPDQFKIADTKTDQS